MLIEQGFLPIRPVHIDPEGESPAAEPLTLAQLLAEIMTSMFEVEDFVRLMVGEAMRGEETARAVGVDLFASFESSIEDWVKNNRPDLNDGPGAAAVARLLSAMVVGIFIQHAADVLGEEGDDLTALSLDRAREAASILRAAGLGGGRLPSSVPASSSRSGIRTRGRRSPGGGEREDPPHGPSGQGVDVLPQVRLAVHPFVDPASPRRRRRGPRSRTTWTR